MTISIPIEPTPPKSGIRWRRVAIVLLVLLIAPASFMTRRAASKMEFFHLRSVVVEGTHYLSVDSVVSRLQLDTLRSVWDETSPLAAKLRAMPQVADVRIRRKLPGTLVITIRENLPVALAPSPRGLEAVDSAGVVLPIDPAGSDLDLPVANQRDKAILTLLGDTRAENPMLYHRISEISRDGADGLVLQLTTAGGFASPVPTDSAEADSAGSGRTPPARMLRVRASMGVSVERLTDIFPVESDLMRRRANVAELDLRYRDQVIARLQ